MEKAVFWLGIALTIANLLRALVDIVGSAHKRIKGPSPIETRLKALESIQQCHSGKLDSDYDRLFNIDKDLSLIMQVLIALLEHSQTGNSTGLMQRRKEELIAHLAGKGVKE